MPNRVASHSRLRRRQTSCLPNVKSISQPGIVPDLDNSHLTYRVETTASCAYDLITGRVDSPASPAIAIFPPFSITTAGVFTSVSRQPVYLDNHATTRTDPRVVEAMLPYFTEQYGNAASVSHRFGWDAAAAVDDARERVARAIGAEAREIVFTSGATEANNLAIKGTAWARTRHGKHLVTAASEHKAVLDPIKRLGAKAGR